jgi:hypothetical protein
MITEMCNFRKHIDTFKYSPVLWLKHAHVHTHKHTQYKSLETKVPTLRASVTWHVDSGPWSWVRMEFT